MSRLFMVFISIFLINIRETNSNPSIYNLRINHLKRPFGIDVKGNLFSFFTEEKGPFKTFLILENKIIDSKEILLNQTHSFFFKEPLEYNKTYKYIVESSSSRAELEFDTAIKL